MTLNQHLSEFYGKEGIDKALKPSDCNTITLIKGTRHGHDLKRMFSLVPRYFWMDFNHENPALTFKKLEEHPLYSYTLAD